MGDIKRCDVELAPGVVATWRRVPDDKYRPEGASHGEVTVRVEPHTAVVDLPSPVLARLTVGVPATAAAFVERVESLA